MKRTMEIDIQYTKNGKCLVCLTIFENGEFKDFFAYEGIKGK